ncbi:MAG: hypothetical protein FGM27_06745, partial [Candidatus Omnitrophica bacterium]|nr:hypothetical protein [Candidatus Omnitrophota bacterium]
MNLIDCNKPKRPVSLRAISAAVIFCYVFTSVDIQLAFSYTSPANIPAVFPSKLSPKEQVSDVHYVQDFDWADTLQPAQEIEETRVEKTPGALPDAPPAAVPDAEALPVSFFQTNNPLKRQEGELIVEEDPKTGVKKFSYSNGSYFKADGSTGSIVEIGDFSQADPGRIQVQRFYYEKGERGQFLTTELAAKEEGLDTFYKYRLDEAGAPVELLRYGVVVKDGTQEERRIALREYQADSVSIFNPLDASAKQVWELDSAGEATRLLAYQGKDFYYTLAYDDGKQQVSVTDQSGKSFVYQLIEGRRFGNLIAVKDSTADGLKEKYQVELTSIPTDGGESLSTFTFRKIEDPEQVIVRESVSGAPGRLLFMKILDAEGSWTHKEFIYGKNEITVLDYVSGTYVKLSFDGDDAKPSPDFWTEGTEIKEFGKILNAQTRETKMQMTRTQLGYEIIGDDGTLWTYERLRDQRMGNLIRLRGPPDRDGKVHETHYTYESGSRTTYDQASGTYVKEVKLSETRWTEIEKGTFTRDASGKYFKLPTWSQSQNVGETFLYDKQSFSFETAFEILSQDGISTAVIVDSLDEQQLQQLLEIPHEIGIAVLYGQVVLFTSGNDYELSVLKAFGDMAGKAQLMAHTHPNSSAGPSQEDLTGAGKMEYVLNRLGVYGYDKDGLRFEEGDFSDFVSLVKSAQSTFPESLNGRVQAAVELNLFITGMDLFRGLPDEFKTSFRADEPVGDALVAYIVAQGALENRLGVNRSNFVRGTIAQAQDGLYEVPLTYQGKTYVCRVNVPASRVEGLKILEGETFVLQEQYFFTNGKLSAVRMTEPNGKITINSLDPDGNTVSVLVKDIAKNQTTFTQMSDGEVIREELYAGFNTEDNTAGLSLLLADIYVDTASRIVKDYRTGSTIQRLYGDGGILEKESTYQGINEA